MIMVLDLTTKAFPMQKAHWLMKNLGTSDRMIRVIIAEICLLAAAFWVGEDLQLPLILATAVILIPVIKGSCGLYQLLGWSSCEIIRRKNDRIKAVFVAAALLLAVVGGFASHILTKNMLIDDLEEVNISYASAVQFAGEDGNNSSLYIDRLQNEFAVFQDKYSRYRPLTVRIDRNFTSQMDQISEAISGSKEAAMQKDEASAYEKLKDAGQLIEAMIER